MIGLNHFALCLCVRESGNPWNCILYILIPSSPFLCRWLKGDGFYWWGMAAWNGDNSTVVLCIHRRTMQIVAQGLQRKVWQRLDAFHFIIPKSWCSFRWNKSSFHSRFFPSRWCMSVQSLTLRRMHNNWIWLNDDNIERLPPPSHPLSKVMESNFNWIIIEGKIKLWMQIEFHSPSHRSRPLMNALFYWKTISWSKT